MVAFLLFLHYPPGNDSVLPVLVVDDDVDSRTLLEMALSEEGYSVLLACNGAEALRLARQSHPRVILLDLAMPVMDGVAFRTALLDDPVLAEIPVIVLTGRTESKEWTGRLRVVGVLSKPPRSTDFEELLARYGQPATPRRPPGKE